MKIFFLLIVFMLNVIPSSGQKKPDEYVLNLDFRPSFLSSSLLRIEAKGDSCIVNLMVYKNYRTKETSIETKTVIPVGRLIALTNFLKTYKFQIKDSTDTIGFHKEYIHGDSVVIYDVSFGSDGIDVKGFFVKKDIVKKFAFWSPDNGTENANLMTVVFDLVDNAFNDQKTIDYLEQLLQYFPHQFNLKKLSDEPLTYKLFGNISIEEEDQFENFLKKLPKHGKVFIDLSNYSGMAPILRDAIGDDLVKLKNIYWLNPSLAGFIDLHKTGISNSKIISKKRLVLEKKNGRELFSLKDD